MTWRLQPLDFMARLNWHNELEGWLEQSRRMAPVPFSMEQLRMLVDTDEARVVGIFKGEHLFGCLVVRPETLPGDAGELALYIMAMGGARLEEWSDAAEAWLDECATQMGAREIFATIRPRLESLAHGRGYMTRGLIVGRRVGELQT
jgi:hypothetical protein